MAAWSLKVFALLAGMMLPNTTRYMQEALDVPLSSTLSTADCDELIAAVRKVAGAMEPGLHQPAP